MGEIRIDKEALKMIADNGDSGLQALREVVQRLRQDDPDLGISWRVSGKITYKRGENISFASPVGQRGDKHLYVRGRSE